ncbi:MAG: hypothetical protein R3E44_00030 [Paracoccaceae bacterium]
MRILSARVTRARRDRADNRVAAIVALTVLRNGATLNATVRVTAPARAPGAASLRDRLLGAAKLSFASDPVQSAWRHAA